MTRAALLSLTTLALLAAACNDMPSTSGLATQLAFTVQPTSAEAGAPITVEVTVQDTEGRTVTDYAGDVTLTLGANPAGGALSGTLTVAAVAGVATFSEVSIAKAGTSYQLQAASGTIASALSAPFSITPAPGSQLAFTVQPTTQTAGVTISPAVEVTAVDQFGNTAIGFTDNVTVTLEPNPWGGVLDGTTTVVAVSGVATFRDLNIDTAGDSYRLVATSGSLTQAMSDAFQIDPAPATQLAFTVEPSTHSGGVLNPINPPVEVTALDQFGGTVTTFTDDVTVAIGTNPSGGVLSGTLTRAAVDGVAIFDDLSIDRTGLGYTLTASATGLSGATSAPFDVVPNGLVQLVFTVQPVDSKAGQAISVEVAIQDALGNIYTAYTGNMAVAIGNNPAGGRLSGSTTVAAVAGVATFSDLSIDVAGTGYTLIASTTIGGTTFQGPHSDPFNITP
jgi:hypothetical protein